MNSFPAEASSKIWRPWDDQTAEKDPKKPHRPHPYKRCALDIQHVQSTHPLQSYVSSFKHPVRLYWTKAAYDYMYDAGERLLRNFPVQATIQVVEESDSEDESDDDFEEDDEDETVDNTLEQQENKETTTKDRKKNT